MSQFYQRHSSLLVMVVVGSCLPVWTLITHLHSNNSPEAWIPQDSPLVQQYEQFKQDFGAEESILVAIENCSADDKLLENLASRLERLPVVRHCWTPERMKQKMQALGVTEAEAEQRLKGLLVARDGRLAAVQAVLSEEGLVKRSAAVAQVSEELRNCGLDDSSVYLAGPPVISAALKYWGSARSSAQLFGGTLLVCWLLVWWFLRSQRLAMLLILSSIYAAGLSLAMVRAAGGQMNFILTALPTMVVVLTLAVAIHYVHYYRWCGGDAEAVGRAWRMALKPCLWCTLTTVVGFGSLAISPIFPVQQFGLAAAGGAVVALIVGLGAVPALLSLWPDTPRWGRQHEAWERLAQGLSSRHRAVAVTALAIVAVSAIGLGWLRSELSPIAFVPSSSELVRDYHVLENRLCGMAPIETVVDFGGQPGTFFQRLAAVRNLERAIASHPQVRSTLSVADFFADRPPTDFWGLARLAKLASQHTHNSYVTADNRRWRITAWVPARDTARFGPLIEQLDQRCQAALPATTAVLPGPAKGGPPRVSFTGVAPLLDHAQTVIFRSFYRSFLLAFGIIAGVMVLSFRSLPLAAMVMVPNIAPLAWVFGTLAWIGIPLDVGTMMTASIALGITIDATLHFSIRQREHQAQGLSATEAVQRTLVQCGPPILKTAVVAGVGLLVLAISPFTPTARFGWLMAVLLGASILGDLVLLPALWIWLKGMRTALKPARSKALAALTVHMASPFRPYGFAAAKRRGAELAGSVIGEQAEAGR